MIDLAPSAVLDGLGLPLKTDGAALSARAGGPITSVAPFRGQAGAAAHVLGLDRLPAAAAAAVDSDHGRLVWSGLDQWFLFGAPPEGLGAHAALTDQGDAWAGLDLAGTDARAVLARLVPLDLDPSVAPDGYAARSLLRHVPLLMDVLGSNFVLRVPRSYAATAVHDLGDAMRAVAARRVSAVP